MVLFTARGIGGHRRYGRRHELVQQYAARSCLRVIPYQQNHHHRQEAAHQLTQRAVEELAEVEGHRVIQHDDVDRTRQRPQRSQAALLHFNADKERHHRQADTEQQHALLRRGDDDQEIERAYWQSGNGAVEEINGDHARVRQTHRQCGHDGNHHHRAAAGRPARPQPEQRAEHAGKRRTPEVDHRVMTLGRFRLDHHFPLEHLFFRRADFGVADHAALKQQITRCGPDPGVDRHRGIAFPGPGNHPTHSLKLLMHVLHRLYRLGKQLAECISDRFRAGVLDKIGFARLGNQR